MLTIKVWFNFCRYKTGLSAVRSKKTDTKKHKILVHFSNKERETRYADRNRDICLHGEEREQFEKKCKKYHRMTPSSLSLQQHSQGHSLGCPKPTLTISFIRKEISKSHFKCRSPRRRQETSQLARVQQFYLWETSS